MYVKLIQESCMDTGIKLELIDEICEIARQNNIDKVVLFGSRARGDYREK